ncbi:MAG: hypothetical protein ACJ72L_06070 [Marmoricola sp.]
MKKVSTVRDSWDLMVAPDHGFDVAEASGSGTSRYGYGYAYTVVWEGINGDA